MPRKKRTNSTPKPAEMTEETPLWMLLRDAAKGLPDSDKDDCTKTISSETISSLCDDLKEMDKSNRQIHVAFTNDNGCHLINFLSCMYAYLYIINKAMDQNFVISEKLILSLKQTASQHAENNMIFTAGECCDAVKKFLEDHQDLLQGISLSQKEIIFSRFSGDEDERRMEAYEMFFKEIEKASHINKYFPTEYNATESEKYDMYQLFHRIKTNTPEFKDMRKYMLERLDGYAAFPNEKRRQEWLKHHREKTE